MSALSSNMLLHEKLEYVLAGTSIKDRAERAKAVQRIDQTFVAFMRFAALKEKKIYGLPEGVPDTYKPATHIPEGYSYTTARQELRRLNNFLRDGSMQSVPTSRRETVWIQMLEGLHWKEAQVLTYIKDQVLLEIYPGLREVLVFLGMPVDVPVADLSLPKPKSSKKKKEVSE